MKTVVVTDIDNTLAHSGWIPDEHVHAIHQLLADGIDVLAATGRRYRSAASMLAHHGLALPIVALNGSVGFDEVGSRFHHVPFTGAVAHLVVERFTAMSRKLVCHMDLTDNDVWAPEPFPEWFDWDSSCQSIQSVDVASYDWSTPDSPGLLAVEGLFATAVDAGYLVAALAETGAVETVVGRTDTGGFYVHVTPHGVNKAHAAAAYLAGRYLGPVRTIAVGDGTNDVALLDWADVSVSVLGGEVNEHRTSDHSVPPPSELGWVQVVEVVASTAAKL
jgi:hydroxymethylpyrimidine pyrophosphatase-like HAD family hydrolase